MAVYIQSVVPGSPAHKAGFKGEDVLFSIDGNEINDMLDYEFYTAKATLEISAMLGGQLQYVTLEKEEYEPLGMDFSSYLIDEQHSCKNKCAFCFVDQLPKGLRAPLYFKDDDERLSFLFGNYITLTNLNEHEVERIKKMRISPINISVHTVDPELRVEIMRNKNAGNVLTYIDDFAKAGIEMNCQIVACSGLNDGEKLRESIEKLAGLYPRVKSIAVVPAGLTKHREGLYPLTPYTQETAGALLDLMDDMTAKLYRKHGCRVAYAADEFYLLAGREMPQLEEYDELLQLENGVGMWRLLHEEFTEELAQKRIRPMPRKVDLATGDAAYPLMQELVGLLCEKYPQVQVKVHVIKNEFFGGNVWVAGLLTGKDIIEQLKGNLHSQRLLLPLSVLNADGDMLLDDVTPKELERELNAKVIFAQSSGAELLSAILRG